MDRRVERVAGLAELISPWAATTRSSCSATPRKPCVERAVLARPVDVVEDLDDRRQGLVRRVLAHQLAVALDPALVVEVLGLEPLEVGGPLGELLLDAAVASAVVLAALGLAALDLGLVGHLGGGVAERARLEVSSTSTESSVLRLGVGHLAPSCDSSSVPL